MTTASFRRAAAAALAGALLVTLAAPARAGQEEQFTPEFRQVRSTVDPKHTPRIEAPESVKRGEWFDVKVTVGVGGAHPSLAEHFVRYIALYKDTVEIARIYLHPVYSAPSVTFTVALDEGGQLRALAEPTHSAAWEAAKPIRVVP
ncbi:MAG TPA: desulfoferrodoxin family protein [Candidatus Tectomicrobia bacterium]|nr:desulfoferrodoxin family protein [Candidatus Tectomicrobia bacterium]